MDGAWPAPERVRALPFHRAGLAEVTGQLEERPSLRERLVLIGARLQERVRDSIPSKAKVSSDVEAGADGAARTRAPRGRVLLVGAGAAALVIYEDGQGRRLTFFIRPPGPRHEMLPQGQRTDGDLLARYWSQGGYNYALVSRSDDPQAQAVGQLVGF